ncbi:MAG: 2-amino-4-hydroxy-6-hydroxymethyldihydropteridine diphosphokinase [Flavobacteriales bacterium]|mgnify:CR=1 FL=1|nr:2-amino-4-hydroxy-6-hydroxymethyldihydropteridine diphosphokinase [Flavobacteriales bacterium]|tara:strand:- start:12656 stop:13144 length:489 start_codon:yes stop_codon:yes gene_type:complete
MNHQVYLGLGSNLGNKLENLKFACDALFHKDCLLLKKSSIYQSEPWGFSSNEPFLNMAVLIETNLSAESLLQKCKRIEKKMGRKPKKGNTYESRIIDIDILYFDDLTINKNDLCIPHKHILNRLFVLKPLVEIMNKDNRDYKELINNMLRIEKKENLIKIKS